MRSRVFIYLLHLIVPIVSTQICATKSGKNRFSYLFFNDWLTGDGGSAQIDVHSN